MEGGTVISLGQVIVDLTMSVEKIPRPGEDVFADKAGTRVGASYNTLHAVRQMGVGACHAGILGTGPWADMIRAVFDGEGIRHIGPDNADRDSGFCVALTDDTAERTFISTRGAEAYGDGDTFRDVDPAGGDIVHISGYTFAHRTGEGLRAFMRRTAAGRNFAAVFDPSPVVARIDDETFDEVVGYRPIWSCNERETTLIAKRLGLPVGRVSFRILVDRMARLLDSTLIVRVGKDGAWLVRPGEDAELVPGFPAHAIDTNGAGDCHAGVLCAELSRGTALREAVRTANAAASIAVTRRGPATCPTRKEVEELLSA